VPSTVVSLLSRLRDGRLENLVSISDVGGDDFLANASRPAATPV
jgi:hypothetical protein